jgi:hypothetical protein
MKGIVVFWFFGVGLGLYRSTKTALILQYLFAASIYYYYDVFSN